MPHCRHVFLALLVLSLFGCAGFQEEPASTADRRTTQTPASAAQSPAWLGPEREVSHYRTLFYGYDTVSYRLAAWGSASAGKPAVFKLLIDARYGGQRSRHYTTAKWADGPSRAMAGLRHETERCQLFNSMVSACLFRDHAALELSRADMEAARTDGLTLTLGSETEAYERIAIPAADIQSLLDAVGQAR